MIFCKFLKIATSLNNHYTCTWAFTKALFWKSIIYANIIQCPHVQSLQIFQATKELLFQSPQWMEKRRERVRSKMMNEYISMYVNSEMSCGDIVKNIVSLHRILKWLMSFCWRSMNLFSRARRRYFWGHKNATKHTRIWENNQFKHVTRS